MSLSFRAWWVPVLAAAVASAALAIGADAGDLPFFVHSADDLLTAAWVDAYANAVAGALVWPLRRTPALHARRP